MEHWSWPPKYDDNYLPPADQEYRLPERETMDPEAREAAILSRIQEVMAYAYDRSPFYRRKWEDAGLEPGDIKTFDDFELVPVVLKGNCAPSRRRIRPLASTCASRSTRS